MIEYVNVREKPREFEEFLEQLAKMGFAYEIIIEDYEVKRMYVKEPDNGDWKNIRHGRVLGSSEIRYKWHSYLPRMVDGKFTYDYNDKNKQR